MTLMHIHNVLLLLATIAAVFVFFAIQSNPGLRSAHPVSPGRPVVGY
jgi:hypothetical protein